MSAAMYTLTSYAHDGEELNDFTDREWDEACERAREISLDADADFVIVRDATTDIGMIVYQNGMETPRV